MKTRYFKLDPESIFGDERKQSTLSENYPFRTKILLPTVSPSNIVGLLLGPKGTFQKKLEEQSGCKILIRAQTNTKDTSTNTGPVEETDPHVTILGDSFEKVQKAKSLVESVIYCDEATKQLIR